MEFRKVFFAPFLLLLSAITYGATPSLTVGTASGQAGTSVTIPISFDPGASAIASLQFNLILPPGISTGTVTAGTLVTNAGKNVSTNLIGSSWTIVIFGVNQTAVSSGSLLSAQFNISPTAVLGSVLNIGIARAFYSDPNGEVVAAGTNIGGSVTVVPPQPSITSAGTASAVVGSTFSYQITATNSPTSFNAAGLPAGLSVNTALGLISGTPSSSGTVTVTLSAANAGGTGTKSLLLTINPPAPVITSAGSATANAGTAFNYQITATNNPTSYNATGLPAGLSINTANGLISGTPTSTVTATILVSATNSGGTGTKTLTLALFSACDVNKDSQANINDIQLEVNMALGAAPCTADVNFDGLCTVVDIQRVINAALGLACVSP